MDTTLPRLRKTFAYPIDDDLPPALDTQEQNDLITTLIHQNQTTNARFKICFLALPIFSVIPYIPLLFTSQKQLAVLSVTSLLCSAYLFWALPENVVGLGFVDGLVSGRGGEGGGGGGRGRRERGGRGDSRGPILRYLPPLNLALSIVILLLSFIKGTKSRASGKESADQVLNYVPIGIHLFTLFVKIVMGSVDVEELAELKYNYKGA